MNYITGTIIGREVACLYYEILGKKMPSTFIQVDLPMPKAKDDGFAHSVRLGTTENDIDTVLGEFLIEGPKRALSMSFDEFSKQYVLPALKMNPVIHGHILRQKKRSWSVAISKYHRPPQRTR